ncbi:MAG: alpha/beta fold hydrolase [Gammaproteobacteria bacterium]|nr:MAG: alpha/beta fold hydrolase [Gammaproteobacteria bacterium]
MGLLARRLRRCGFDVRAFSWPTVNHTLAQNAERLQRFVSALDTDVVHFVGYSLGGILVRALFHYHPQQRPGRIVTIVSPHGGSQVARVLSGHALGRRILGEGVRALLEGVVERWGMPPREIGTLSGSMSAGLGRLFVDFTEPNDGQLTITETQLSSARDAIILKASHFGMLLSRQVACQTCHFLRTGRFSH